MVNISRILAAMTSDEGLDREQRDYLRIPRLEGTARQAWNGPEIRAMRQALADRLLATVLQELVAAEIYAGLLSEGHQQLEAQHPQPTVLAGLRQCLSLAEGELLVIAAVLRPAGPIDEARPLGAATDRHA